MSKSPLDELIDPLEAMFDFVTGKIFDVQPPIIDKKDSIDATQGLEEGSKSNGNNVTFTHIFKQSGIKRAKSTQGDSGTSGGTNPITAPEAPGSTAGKSE